MEPTRHLEILRTEGERLASVPPEFLDAAVPALPDWTVERVLRHTGKIHQWVAAVVTTGDAVDTAELPGIASGPACIVDYRRSLDAVATALTDADPAAPVFTFAGPGDMSFWMRRQAQEVTVHRMDAHDAIAAAGGGEPAPMAIDGAADGIDEWARLFLASRFGQRFGSLPGELDGHTIHIHGTDDPAPADGAEWLLSFDGGAVQIEALHAKGDVAVRGPAANLLLALWRRRPLDSVDVFGDRSVAERLLEVATF